MLLQTKALICLIYSGSTQLYILRKSLQFGAERTVILIKAQKYQDILRELLNKDFIVLQKIRFWAGNRDIKFVNVDFSNRLNKI